MLTNLFTTPYPSNSNPTTALKAKVQANNPMHFANANANALDELLDFANNSKVGQKVQALFLDPPWNYGKPHTHTSFTSSLPHGQYPTMSMAEIFDLPVPDLLEKDAAIFMWVPNSLIPEAIEKATKNWKVKYRSMSTWSKPSACASPGILMPSVEFLVQFGRGKISELPLEPSKTQGGNKGVTRIATGYSTIDYHRIDKEAAAVFDAKTRIKVVDWLQTVLPKMNVHVTNKQFAHSQKPTHFQDYIDKLLPTARKMELFARQPRNQWATWGNQCGSLTQSLPWHVSPAKKAA